MIIFNTIKKAEHYVKWCNKNIDYQEGGYDWRIVCTSIDGEYVIRNYAGDGCGCGCDLHLYDYHEVIGRIKAHDTKTIRSSKIDNVLN